MSNEISLSATLTYTNPASNVKANTISFVDPISVTASPAYQRNVAVVTTSLTALSLALISTLGYTVVHNADATHAISVYLNTTDTGSLLLLPGEWQVLRFDPSDVPQVKCSAGNPLIEYYALSA
jgi:hypothetical protein